MYFLIKRYIAYQNKSITLQPRGMEYGSYVMKVKNSAGAIRRVDIEKLKKAIGRLYSKEHPKKATLDSLSLLAGFQDWDSMQKALRGE